MKAEDIAADQICSDEGYRQKPYRDSKGIWTIGIGFNLESHGYTESQIQALEKDGWSYDYALQKLHERIAEDVKWMSWWPLWSKLNEPRKAVLLNMAYQLGQDRLSKFKKMLAAVSSEDWETAAFEMRNSIWAKHDSPARAVRLAKVMETGELQ